MNNFTEFKQYYSLADEFIDELSQDELAECARMLALHRADYAQRFGDIPHPDLLSLLGVEEISEEHATLLKDGMQLLVGYLTAARDQADGQGGEQVH